MQIFPLIARPCAWRIAAELAALQARPSDGRPLALRSNAEIDLALSELVYELADRLKLLPASIASEERDLLGALPPATTTIMSAEQFGFPTLQSRPPMAPIEQGQTWVGTYHPTGRQLKLMISERAGSKLFGQMEYADDGSATDVEGEVRDFHESTVDAVLGEIEKSMHEIAGTVTLREIRIVREGRRPPQLNGEYLAFVGGSMMKGVWRSGGIARGHIELQLRTA